MKSNMLVILIFGAGVFCLTPLTAQRNVPAIYVSKEGRCSGDELFRLQAECAKGNTGDCQKKIDAEMAYISKNCGSDGKEVPKDPKPKTEESKIEVLPPPDRPDTESKPIYTDHPGQSCGERGVYWELANQIAFNYCPIVQNGPKCTCTKNSSTVIGQANGAGLKNNTLMSYMSIIFEKKQLNSRNYSDELLPFKFDDDSGTWQSSEKDESSKYDFKFIVPYENQVNLISKSSSSNIPTFSHKLFEPTGNDVANKAAIKLLKQLSIMATQNIQFNVYQKPLPATPRSLIGHTSGDAPYLFGLDQNGSLYYPVHLHSVQASRKLIRQLGVDKSPLQEIINDWYKTGKEDQIVAFVNGVRNNYNSPEDVWNNTDFNYINTSSARFLIGRGDTFIVKDAYNRTIKIASWYPRVSGFQNPFLAALAIADPEAKVEVYSNHVIFLPGQPSNLFVITLAGGEVKPEVKAYFDENLYNPARRQAICNNLMKNQQNFDNYTRKIQTDLMKN